MLNKGKARRGIVGRLALRDWWAIGNSQTRMLCLALSCLVCGGAVAVGKITVDPNTPEARTSQAVAKADPRVAQKVTYEAKYQTVRQILEDLTAMTGIKLYSGSNKWDWVVRSRKMNIFVKDVKMANLMNSIAHVMKFKWSCNNDLTPPTYRLVVDGKAAAAADAQKARAESEYEKRRQERRQEWIDAIMKYGTWSTSQIETLRDADPIVYEYARRGAIEAIRALFVEVPEAKSRYAAGLSFRISADKLSSETKSLLFNAGNELWKYLQISRRNEPIGYGDYLKLDDGFDIAFNRLDAGVFTPNLIWGAASAGSTGYFHIVKGTETPEIADLPRMDWDRERYRSVAHNKILDGIDRDQAWAQAGSPSKKLKDVLREEEESLYPSEPLYEHSESPELQQTIKLKIDAQQTEQSPALAINSFIASLQKALADAMGLGVVSDSWVSINGDKLSDQEAKLGELLDKFCTQFNYNWDKPSTILEFRHRKWRKNRLNQIPEDWVAAWSENTKKNGVLSLDDLAQISNLTYEQAEESLKADKVLGTAGIYQDVLTILDTNGNLHWLRLYSSLSPQLRALLIGKYGINGHMLTSDQWKQAQTMFDRIGSTRGDAIFQLEVVTDKKKTTSRFYELDSDTGEVDREWKVRLPKYQPPALQ